MELKPKISPASAIGAVERETGLSKDTLRIWERRYGFPQPARDSNGERAYPSDQVEKLRVIRRLMDRGLRPGRIVQMPLRELNDRFSLMSMPGAPQGRSAPLLEAMRLLKAHDEAGLRECLAQLLLRLGLQRFVIDAVAPLNEMVGDAWMQGRIETFEEHLYSEQIQHLLHQALGPLSPGGHAPRVLLTTLPGEEHQLGLLMAHACLVVEGAQCISLGMQTPVWDVVRAARAHRADIVGLSFSAAMQLRAARAGLAELRQQLDRGIALWAGGSIWRRVQKAMPGVIPLASLADIPFALEAWRAAQIVRAPI